MGCCQQSRRARLAIDGLCMRDARTGRARGVRGDSFSSMFVQRLNAGERNHTFSRLGGLIGGFLSRLSIA